VRIRNVRAGSVVIDSEVTVSSASQLSVTNSILTNPTVTQQVPEFGQSMSVVAVGSDTTCQAFSTSSTCIATSGCGWCSAVATCMPGTNAGATVPAGSMSTCSGSDWLFGQSCASIYLVVSTCMCSVGTRVPFTAVTSLCRVMCALDFPPLHYTLYLVREPLMFPHQQLEFIEIYSCVHFVLCIIHWCHYEQVWRLSIWCKRCCISFGRDRMDFSHVVRFVRAFVKSTVCCCPSLRAPYSCFCSRQIYVCTPVAGFWMGCVVLLEAAKSP
jgi:hypothetical protein